MFWIIKETSVGRVLQIRVKIPVVLHFFLNFMGWLGQAMVLARFQCRGI